MLYIKPLSSPIMERKSAEKLTKYFTYLLRKNNIELQVTEEINNKPFAFLILSGGTEYKVINFIDELDEPIILLCHEKENSFPACLEILAGLNQAGKRGKIIIIDNKEECFQEIKDFIKIITAKDEIKKMKAGLMGDPSDWLVAGNVNIKLYNRLWGLEVVKIPVEEVICNIKNIEDKRAVPFAQEFIDKACKCVEPDFKDLVNGAKVYLAIKEIKEKYSLTSLSLRCFDLLEKLGTTGCYALSMLNDEKIIAGCEGDLPSLLTMVWMYCLTGKIPFMANPQTVDREKNTLSLAHCTIGRSLVESYKIRSHFESSIGVGIEGSIENGPITLARIGGKELNRIFISDGEILKKESSPARCRTQVKIKLHKSVKYFLDHPLGNHHVLIKGHYSGILEMFRENFVKTKNP